MNQQTKRRANAARVHIRWMIRRDHEYVLNIEWLSFAHPWTHEDLLSCLRDRTTIGMVAEHGDTVAGFMVYELRKKSLGLLNLAVHPDWRRRGVGAQLTDKLISKLSGHRRTWISTLVRETNLPAQLFFRAQGFLATGVTRGYYEGTGEDAYRMQYLLHILETP